MTELSNLVVMNEHKIPVTFSISEKGFVALSPVSPASRSEFFPFSAQEKEETKAGSTPTSAPSPPSTGATVTVTGHPADPTYSHGNDNTALTVNLGYVLAIGVGMYLLGRAHQYFKDEKRGLGPKPPKGGQP